MLRSTISNRDRQENEILILSSIYNNHEFSYNTVDTVQCYYNVFLKISEYSLQLKNAYANNNMDTDLSSMYFVKHLPPVRMYLQLPCDYPTISSPNFYITACWLSPWQISSVCQKLDEMWSNNKGQEILFLWFEFLRNELLSFLFIEDTLDISFMFMTYYNLNYYFQFNASLHNDIRAIYNISFLNPIIFLVQYDKAQQKIEFERNYYICKICFEGYCGKKCIQFQNCSHTYCKQCMQQYISTKIKEGTMNNITCPDLNCTFDITMSEIRDLCPDLFLEYEDLLLRGALASKKDIIYCPRILCHCPFVNDIEDSLAICDKCYFAFCTYCHKVYHGVTPCAMSLVSKEKLIEDYLSGSTHQKELLQMKYGRKQIQIVVETYLTEKYLKANTKPCPNCGTVFSKIDGCNKMTCVGCNINFCWICGVHITTSNAYEHFLSNNNECYKRLFEYQM